MKLFTPGPRCIKLFARLFFCHKKTLADLYANCNGIFFLPEFPDFCRKKLRQKVLCNWALDYEFVDQKTYDRHYTFLLQC